MECNHTAGSLRVRLQGPPRASFNNVPYVRKIRRHRFSVVGATIPVSPFDAGTKFRLFSASFFPITSGIGKLCHVCMAAFSAFRAPRADSWSTWEIWSQAVDRLRTEEYL